MSNLKLNIPITFEAGAALQIKEDITQSVQNSYGMLTTFNQSATGFDMFLSYLDSTNEHYSGLSIDQNKIILDAAYTYIQVPGGGRTEFFSTADGKAKINTNYITADNVTANSLNTTGSASTININAGIIKCISPSTATRIEFGIDDNNNAVLKFIRNDVEIYNLGPDGLMCLNFETTENKFTPINYKIKSGVGEYYAYNANNHSIISVVGAANSSVVYAPFMKATLTSLEIGTDIFYRADITNSWDSRYSKLIGNTFSDKVFYENINYLFNGEKLLILDLEKFNSSLGDTYYLFTSGHKEIQGVIGYYDGDGNIIQTMPSYNGKTYKSNTISINYLTNSSNYIDDDYYLNELGGSSDGYWASLMYNNSNSQYFNNIQFRGAKYTSIYTSSNNLQEYGYVYDIDATNIKGFYINKFINGNNTKILGYFIKAFTYDELNNSNATYMQSYDLYYGTHEIGGGTDDTNIIDNSTLGILCNSVGDIFTVKSLNGTDISTYIDEYITWLNS